MTLGFASIRGLYHFGIGPFFKKTEGGSRTTENRRQITGYQKIRRAGYQEMEDRISNIEQGMMK